MKRRCLAVAALFLAVPAPAFANIYVPSFVQVITAPLVWSLFVFTLVVTIPVVFAIGFIEALVLRKYVEKSLCGLTWSPDGRFIAYMGKLSPYASSGWYADVRVVSSDGKRSATFYRHAFTAGYPSRTLLWLP